MGFEDFSNPKLGTIEMVYVTSELCYALYMEQFCTVIIGIWVKILKISKILNFRNSNFKTCRMPKNDKFQG